MSLQLNKCRDEFENRAQLCQQYEKQAQVALANTGKLKKFNGV